MTMTALVRTCLLAGTVFLSSCAYMQTHKNIEESSREHTGYTLNKEFELYRAGGKYYLAAEQKQLRVHYPVIHDSIFLSGNNAPEYRAINNETSKVYHEISAGTAMVLQRPDGYADMQVVSDELKDNSTPWLQALPGGASKCSIKAEIAGDTTTWPQPGSFTETPISIQALSMADRILIDWPGTLLYNISIPVMAPFVFFHEFLNEQ